MHETKENERNYAAENGPAGTWANESNSEANSGLTEAWESENMSQADSGPSETWEKECMKHKRMRAILEQEMALLPVPEHEQTIAMKPIVVYWNMSLRGGLKLWLLSISNGPIKA